MTSKIVFYNLKENNAFLCKVGFTQENKFYIFFDGENLTSIYGDYVKEGNKFNLKINKSSYGFLEIIDDNNCYVYYVKNLIEHKRKFTYNITEEENVAIIIPEGHYIENIKQEDINKFFSLNDSFCAAPWVHLYLDGSGNAFPCCKNKKSGLGNISSESIKDLWNNEKLKQIRKNMIKGNTVPSCETCYLNEKRWGVSYRTFFNSKYANKFDLIKNTNLDGSLENVNISFLDLRYSNLCNLKCIMCSPYSSSAWTEDAKKLNMISEDSDYKPINFYENIKDQLPNILENVERINFAGGEPLLIKENYEILDKLIELKRFDVELTYNTNFSKLKNYNHDILSKWSLFKDLTIKASLDATHKRGEYIRKGLVWKDFFNNRMLLKEKAPHAKFKIFCTVQLLNVMHIPEMYRYLKSCLIIDGAPESFHLSFLDWPRFYDIRSLPIEIKNQINESYGKFIDSLETQKLKDHFNKVLIYLNEKDFNHGEEFKEFTNKLDEIRKQSTRETFPELKEYFDNINL